MLAMCLSGTCFGVGRRARPDHGFTEELGTQIPGNLQITIAQRSDLDLIFSIVVDIQDPAAIPLAAGDRFGVADHLLAADTAIAAVLGPDDATAQIASAIADLDRTTAGVVKPYADRLSASDGA